MSFKINHQSRPAVNRLKLLYIVPWVLLTTPFAVVLIGLREYPWADWRHAWRVLITGRP